MNESFAQALLYAEQFSRANRGMFPHLFHQMGTKTGGGTGFYCPECDPKIERQAYRPPDVQHISGCQYLAFRRALTAAKQLDENPQAQGPGQEEA